MVCMYTCLYHARLFRMAVPNLLPMKLFAKLLPWQHSALSSFLIFANLILSMEPEFLWLLSLICLQELGFESSFFFFFFSLRALKLLVHILYLSSYDRNWLTNLQKFPANYSFLCSFKHWKCLFPFSHLLIWYIVFFLNVKNLNFPEHNEAFTDSCFLTFSPIHIFPVVFSLRALETEWQLSKYRVGVRFVWCFLAVNNA